MNFIVLINYQIRHGESTDNLLTIWAGTSIYPDSDNEGELELKSTP
jgi:hypothetical protein